MSTVSSRLTLQDFLLLLHALQSLYVAVDDDLHLPKAPSRQEKHPSKTIKGGRDECVCMFVDVIVDVTVI